MVFRRFVYFPVLFIEKYRYCENRVAIPNLKKSLQLFKKFFNWSKNGQRPHSPINPEDLKIYR
jgi:hypothetical protein